DAISIAIEKNLDIKIQGFVPTLRKADIGVEEGIFDPNLELDFSEQYKENQTSTQLAGTKIAVNRKHEVLIDFGQRLRTGATYDIKWIFDRNDTNSRFVTEDPHYTSELLLEVKQPLLKDRGRDIQEANIHVAENDYKIAKLDLESKTLSVINEVEKLYWDLFHAYDELAVSKLSVKLAKTLYEVSKAKIDAGVLAPVEILVPEADIASREEELINAEKRIRDADDKLKLAMHYRDWNREFIPVDRPPFPTTAPDLNREIAEAFKMRLDLKKAIIEKKSRDITVRLARNKVLPDLSIVGGVGINGLNQNFHKTFEDQFSIDFYSWKVGLTFNMPIGNRTAKSNLLKAKAQSRQATIFINKIKEKIIADVREAVRTIEVALKHIDASVKSEALAKERLENEQEKFKVGMSTAHDVLQFQESYTRALSNKKKALTDYAKALADLKLIKRVPKIKEELRPEPIFRGVTGGRGLTREITGSTTTEGSQFTQ
ncbi:MAG: TolC family protein, partial [Nitrospirae bacterium]